MVAEGELLLALAALDQIEIRQSATRHQLITLSGTPTVSSDRVTVSGRANRGLGSQLPQDEAVVVVKLIPEPIQGVDQTARDTADENAATHTTHAADPNAHHTPGGGPSTFTSLQSVGLANAIYTFTAASIAAALLDGTGNYKALLVSLEDFTRHQNNWRIPLGIEDYADNVNHEFYHAYVNNSTGAVGGMNLSVQRTSGTVSIFLSLVTTGVTFDAGTSATIYGES